MSAGEVGSTGEVGSAGVDGLVIIGTGPEGCAEGLASDGGTNGGVGVKVGGGDAEAAEDCWGGELGDGDDGVGSGEVGVAVSPGIDVLGIGGLGTDGASEAEEALEVLGTDGSGTGPGATDAVADGEAGTWGDAESDTVGSLGILPSRASLAGAGDAIGGAVVTGAATVTWTTSPDSCGAG